MGSKALFILKRREDYSTDLPGFTNYTVATGMYNSAKFVSDMLNQNGVPSIIEIAIDNNCIDRLVTQHKPTHVFIEGLWVVPEKFDILKKLHPNVEWVIRIHSELPFLAQEGIALEWINGYLKRAISVSGNSLRINSAISNLAKVINPILSEKKIPLLPNYYPINDVINITKKNTNSSEVHIGCFGAIRPLKNHLTQAFAAIEYAKRVNKKLYFHINSTRIESGGNNILKNIRALFNSLNNQFQLVEHGWLSHNEFLNLIATMDILLQVSFSETFNIVTADAVSQAVPVVVSKEISWVQSPKADPTSVEEIEKTIHVIFNNRYNYAKRNIEGLKEYSNYAKNNWLNYLGVTNNHNKSGCDYIKKILKYVL